MSSLKANSSSDLPEPRQAVEKMKTYTAPLEGRRKLLRLDFNENTVGPSPLVTKALLNIPPENISIYPEYNGLKEAIVENLNKKIYSSNKIDPLQIGLFNGVDAAIHAIFHSYGNNGDQLLTTTPTFGYYSPCAHMQGMEIIAVPYLGENFDFPLKEIQTTLKEQKPKILLICNPNNPTGTQLAAKEIVNLSQMSPNTLIVIDELYEAFTGDSVLPIVDFKKYRNIVILRSLSKTSGLAGLRIGFAIGHPQIIDIIQRVTGPYDINSFAVTAAFAALEDQAYIDDYITEVLAAKRWVHDQLILKKIRHHISGGNYFLIWPKDKPEKIITKMKEKGILIRDMKGKTLINDSIRVSIGTTTQMKYFFKIFNEIDQINC
tara:strand:- start:51719 stop:52846 length:1128 start_codon:yes stop_codon:yes gene_type:complete